MKIKKYKLKEAISMPLVAGVKVWVPIHLNTPLEDKLIYQGKELRPCIVLKVKGSKILVAELTHSHWYDNSLKLKSMPNSYVVLTRLHTVEDEFDFPEIIETHRYNDAKEKIKYRIFNRDADGKLIIKHTKLKFNINNYLNDEDRNAIETKINELYGDIKNLKVESLQEHYLQEEVRVNDTLNTDLWENDELKEEVNEKLLDIVDAFLDKLKEDNININVVDVRLLGSNANYNYTDKSDIDLHIVADIDSLPCEQHVLSQLYDAYRSLFNKKYNINIKGHEVEIYVEDVKSPAKSNGVYSLYTGWISKPDKTQIPEIDYEEFERVFKEYEDRYFAIMKEVKYESEDNLEESSSFRRHLKDCIGNVEYFVVYDNIKDMHFEDDVLDEEWDESDAFWYLQQNDDTLKQLSKDDVEKIDNVELLDRLFKLDANKLSKEQQDKMKEIYKQKVIISKEDVEKLLEEFRQCNDIYDNGYKKTRTFLRDYDLTLDNCLEIIHNLKVSDYCANTKSINLNHLGDNLIIFEPKNVKLSDGRELGDFIIYVKLDVDESTKNVVSMVSMHKADYADKLSYSESLNEELEMSNEYCELEESSSFKRSFDDFLKDAQVVLVDDARTFDINRWEQELEDEINETLGEESEHLVESKKTFIKYKLDKEKVKKIVDKIIASDIDITDYWKTKQFLKKYNLVKDDLKEVVKELKDDDYKTNSIETNDLENEAMIFIKNSKVKDLGPFKLFIKLDYDSIEDTPVVVISFHQAKRNRKKNESLDKQTPYMLRSDGKVIKCKLKYGTEVHPYLLETGEREVYNREKRNDLIKYIMFNSWEFLESLEFLYENTQFEEVKRDIINLVSSIVNSKDYDSFGREEELIKDYENTFPINNDQLLSLDDCVSLFISLDNQLNQEFLRIRTSDKHYGGNGRSTYFRVSSKGFNWFDLILNFVINNKQDISDITVCHDYNVFGDEAVYICGGKPLDKMDVETFLTLEGNPIIESKDKELYESYLKNIENINLIRSFSHHKHPYFSNRVVESFKNKNIVKYELENLLRPDSNKRVIKEDIEMSNEYDSEGNQLTKAQADFFKNSKVRDDKGRLLVCYHGTSLDFSKKPFNTFDKTRFCTGNGDICFGAGFYFTPSRKEAKSYADAISIKDEFPAFVFETYLNITNPLIIPEKETDLLKMFENLKITLSEEAIDEIKNSKTGVWSNYFESLLNIIYGNNGPVEFTKTLIKNNYDGVIFKDEIVAFESNQIKSIDNSNPTNSDNINEELLLTEAKVDIDNFINKFGEETYNNFLKAKDRLKQKGYSTDITYYFKNFEKDKLIDLLASLYDEEKDSQKQRIIKDTDKEIRGKYKYLGEKDGYKVYQPLDYIASMDLGVNTGWCTTGRYGHYGHPEYTPSEEDAKRHWNDYTSNGIKFYYFLDSKTMYGKYALALYPRVLNVNKKITPNYFLKSTNFELFNEEDMLDYSMINNLPIDLIKDKVEVDFEELNAQSKMIKLNSGKEAYLVVYNQNPLVIGLECETSKTTWKDRYNTLYAWYEKEVPDKLKKYLKKEDLHNLCCENLLDKLENWMKPIEDKSRAFRLDYFPSVACNKSCIQRQYYGWYWLDTAFSDLSYYACFVNGDIGNVNFNFVMNSFIVRPTFFNVNPEILKEFNIS